MTPTVRVGQTSSGGPPEHESDIPVTLPLEEVLVGRSFICGKSGSGKSNTGGRVAEEILDAGRPLLIVDIEGEYYGLKEEYEILHAGADEACDIQVGPEHGERLAQLGIEQGVPIILDLSGFLDESEANDLVGAVARALFAVAKQEREPFPVFIEECHEFLPEQGSAGETGEAVVRIAKRGRKHGLGLVGISQRPATVDKDFITQCNWMVWHRLTWDNDVAVIRRVLGTSFAESVADLGNGEAFLAADPDVLADDDRFGDVLRVQFDRKQTYDAGQAPGLDDERRPELKGVDEGLVEELQAISDRTQQRQNERKRLREKVADREERIEELEAELADTKDIRGIMDDMVGSVADHAGPGSSETSTAGDQEPVTVTIEGQELQIPEVIQTEVMEIREGRAEAEARVEELEIAHTREQRAAEHLTERLADRPTSEDIEALRQFAAEFGELTDRHADVVGDFADVSAAGSSDERLTRLRERAQTAEEQVEELEGEVERLRSEATVVDEQFSDKMEFVRTDAVREQIETAAEKAKTNAEHTWDVVFFLADCDEPMGIEAILPVVEVAESSVRDILARLKDQHIVFVNQDGRKHTYRLNVSGMETVVEQQRRREEINDLREDVGVQDA
jgi:archaellum component FlaC